jgi:excisionase family DNA binding protein
MSFKVKRELQMDAPKIQELRADSLLTSYQVGALLQVNPSSVNKWVKDGRIPAFRTPGGHRRIRAADLVAFLTQHKMPIPHVLSAASRRRVLIVDHEAHHLETLERAAKAAGDRLEVIGVTNGVDAMVEVGAFRPHMVLLDVHMPNFDCFEVCRRLKEGRQTAPIVVWLACQQLTPELQQRATQAGANACIAKPVNIDAILQALGAGEPAIA